MKYRPKNKYVFGVLMAILVLTVNQLFIQYWLNQKSEESRMINLSGRQRMLSQKINLEYFQMLNQELSYNELIETFKNWQAVHFALLNGNKALSVHPVANGDARKILVGLSKNIEYIHQILNEKPTIDLNIIQKINKNQADFLIKMDDVVKKMEDESDKKLRFIVIIEIILAILSIFIIAAEVIYVYQPIEKQLLKTIDELESSESKLLAILDSSTDINIFISPDLKVLNFNKSAEENVLLLHQKQLKVGEDFTPFITTSTYESFHEAFGEALHGEITITETELTFNGEKIWFKIRFFPVYDSHLKIIGVTFNATSIDERKKAEIKVNEQLNILKEIAWQQSHLVRSPLVNILGISTLLTDKEYQITDEEQQLFLTQLGDEANRLDIIIKDIVHKTYYVYHE
ncbi:PAS domain-containing protein [Arcicella aquatica]|uniref:histidine kinase n=1 Tax=Arcicella aquatica TaxID=217141 RepID=A0ABU5QQ71_9BACT|nr:PAS domain-containing protein [Arcicella aquatica]MEA5259238.1 PAS domain-containing protein [Arcicella aquatica]